MRQLERDDGIEIHWEERGEGPAVLIAHASMISMPGTFDALITDLAADHRVVTWDPRGTGRSSRSGPYDVATDAADMAALVDQVAHPVVTVSIGYNPVPLALADKRPELVGAVVLVGGIPRLGPLQPDETPRLLDSASVAEAARELGRSDPRALLRTVITVGNPQLSEDEVRDRLEAQLVYCPPDVAMARGEAFIGYDATRTCPGLSRRLWIIHWENPMSPDDAVKRARELLPQAHIVEVEDGPISRPDITAGVVRHVTAPLRAS